MEADGVALVNNIRRHMPLLRGERLAEGLLLGILFLIVLQNKCIYHRTYYIELFSTDDFGEDCAEDVKTGKGPGYWGVIHI